MKTNETTLPLPARSRVAGAKARPSEHSASRTQDDQTGCRFEALLKQHAAEKGNLVSLSPYGVFPDHSPGNNTYGKHLYGKKGEPDNAEPLVITMTQRAPLPPDFAPSFWEGIGGYIRSYFAVAQTKIFGLRGGCVLPSEDTIITTNKSRTET